MVETTLYQIFSACFSSFAVGFALCNVIYQFAKSSDHRTSKRKKSGLPNINREDSSSNDQAPKTEESAAGATAALSEYMNEQRKTIKETQKAFAVEKETGSH